MQNSSSPPSAAWFIIAFTGCVMSFTAAAALVLPFVLPDALLGSFASIVVGIGLTLAMLGIGLLVTGIRGWQAKQSRLITTRWGWLILLLIMFAVVVVALLLPAKLQSEPVFAPFHFAMITLPAFIGLLLVIRLSGTHTVISFRQVILGMSGGASSVLLAFSLEIIGLVMVVALVFIGASIFPAGRAEVSRLLAVMQQWMETPPSDMDTILSITTSPVALICIVLILSLVTPLIEEFVKTLVLGVMGLWMRPGLAQAFIWGMSCGLGFAVVEGITNGSVGLEYAGWWLGSIFARLMASMMHAFTSGLVGMGWGSLWERKWWRMPLFYALAVIFHGLWNFSVIILALGGILSASQIMPGLVLVVLGGGLLVICVSVVSAALIGIPVILKRRRANLPGASQVKVNG